MKIGNNRLYVHSITYQSDLHHIRTNFEIPANVFKNAIN